MTLIRNSFDHVVVDEEFSALIPPLQPDERLLLEENLLRDGCRDALVVWAEENILLDGHNRLEICRRLNIPYETVGISLPDREAAEIWLLNNQLGRRNLNAYQRSVMALTMKQIFAEQAKKSQGTRTDIPQISVESLIASKKDREIKEVVGDNTLGYDAKIQKLQDIRQGAWVENRRHAKAKAQCVYLARAGNRLKIGLSLDPEGRIEQLGIGDPDIQLLATYPGDLKLEKNLHRIADNYSLGREWFQYSDELLEEIKKYIKTYDRHENETNRRLAHLAGVSHDTIAKVEAIEKKASPDQVYKLKTGKATINQVYTALKREETQRKRKDLVTKIPVGKFAVILADPPWQYSNSGFNEAAESQYPTMSTDDICAMAGMVRDFSTPETVLFMWATNPLLEDAIRVLKAWGFTYKTNMCWVKDRGRGKGWFLKSRHEILLIGTRENTPHPQVRPDSCFEADRGPVHSRKPGIVYDIIESMFGGSKLEMFCRTPREGWEAHGNEC